MKKNMNLSILYLLALAACSTNTQETLASKQAKIRIGTPLCAQENQFLITRSQHIKKTLQDILGITIKDANIPRIALCASGGGFRAMIATLGWLEGSTFKQQQNSNKSIMSMMHYVWQLISGQQQTVEQSSCTENIQQPKLCDICSHFATLSGSTWAAAGLEYSCMTPKQYLNHIAPSIDASFFKNINMQDLVIELKKKESYQQPISFIDIYGIMLAQKLLSNLDINQPSSIDISNYATRAQSVTNPLMIQTALIGNDDTNYQWIEFSPFEVGSTYLKTFIPTWAFGRTFNAGLSTNTAPPQSLGFCMGIWGSAISVDARDFFRLIVEPQLGSISWQNLQEKFGSEVASAANLFVTLEAEVSQFLSHKKEKGLLDYRIWPATIANWNVGLEDLPLTDDATLTLIDGGIDCNLPIFPLLRPERNIDIIIILDASAGTFGNELRNAEQHAKKWGMPFPAINYTTINQPCSVHWDMDHKETPIVIYLPLIKNMSYNNDWDPYNAAFTSTFNFTYTPEEISLLSGLTACNMTQSLPVILDTIKQWIMLH